jgi:hypothetical protein
MSTEINWNNLTEEKAKQIFLESSDALKGTIHVRDILEKKTIYILGYCLLWISSLLSYAFINQCKLGFFLVPIILYIFAIIGSAILMIENLKPDDFNLEGNLSKNIIKTGALNQDYDLFLVGIAQEKDGRFEKNFSLNKKKASRIKTAIQIIVFSSLVASLFLVVVFFAQSLDI